MIIDVHGHMSAPDKLWAYKATLIASRGSHGRGHLKFSDDQIRESMHDKGPLPDGHIQMLDKHKTNVRLVSPRPFQMMHWLNPFQQCRSKAHHSKDTQPRRLCDGTMTLAGLAKQQPGTSP
jgi:hypothetical protein